MAAVKNTLTAAKQKTSAPVIFQVNGMEVKLTPSIVKNYLVSGDKERVTDQEVAMFINMCKFSSLNPWLKEAYCIKYGNEPATMVVGKEAFMKRAELNPEYDGFEAGIIVFDPEAGTIDHRVGTITISGEQIIGGWAEVWRKDRAHSVRLEVSFEEYAGRKKDGTLNRQWAAKPATMIRKVALVQALREAFPASLGNMFTAEEQGVEDSAEFNMPPVNPEVVEAEVVKTAAPDTMVEGDDSLL